MSRDDRLVARPTWDNRGRDLPGHPGDSMTSARSTLGCRALRACVASALRSRRAPTPPSRSGSSRPCSPAAASTSSRGRSASGWPKALGQPVVVENQSGGGGIVGSQATARAAPDGYTLMVGYVGTHGTNPAVRKLPYDAVKDFTPIAMVGGTPNVLVVPPSLPVKTLPEFIAYAKANKGKLSYGSPGPGTLTHLAMEQFKVATDLDIVHVAYRGIGPAITDILGGQTQALFPGLAAALPHIKAGKMRPLAVTGTRRHPLLPDVPTFEELGYKGFDGVQWYGIVGPANMPPAIVTTLNTEINKMLADPQFARAALRRGARSRCR